MSKEKEIQNKIYSSNLWKQDSNGNFVSCGMEVLGWHEKEVSNAVEAERERIRKAFRDECSKNLSRYGGSFVSYSFESEIADQRQEGE